MIDLYYWKTSNGHKATIVLEEMGLPYRLVPIDIFEDAQFSPEFVAINPNAKIPAIVDPEGPSGKPVSVFETGAILTYLAEKTGQFLPKDALQKLQVTQWMYWQAAGFGPMLGQVHHFNRKAPEGQEYARNRYQTEARRLYSVLDTRLTGRDFIVDDYSIADMMCFPWVTRHEWQDIALSDYPNVARWFEMISARPAVIRALARVKDV